MKTILQVCAFGAPNAGNFIASLLCLEEKMREKGYRTIYAFPEKAREKEWCKEIEARTKVYFLPEAKARILPKTYRIFRHIYKIHDISIVHCHFELYDIPATVMAGKDTKVFWHLHDPVNFHQGIRAVLWKIQYAVVGKRARLLAVSDFYRNEVVNLGFPKEQSHVVLNSISLDRIKPCTNFNKEYEFLTFGWDFFRKGDDVILKACDRLWNEGYRFKLLLNGNEHTWGALDQYFQGDADPRYLVRGNPVEDVNALFSVSKVFIQASRRETFSYAVCEAAYAGLPVFCSDISGLEWAHEVPTVCFFPSENVDVLHDLLRTYLDSGVVQGDKKISQQVIREHFSLEVWANRIIDFYEI